MYTQQSTPTQRNVNKVKRSSRRSNPNRNSQRENDFHDGRESHTRHNEHQRFSQRNKHDRIIKFVSKMMIFNEQMFGLNDTNHKIVLLLLENSILYEIIDKAVGQIEEVWNLQSDRIHDIPMNSY